MSVANSLVEIIRDKKVIYRHEKTKNAGIFIKNCVAWFGSSWLNGISVDEGDGVVDADLWLANLGDG